MKTHSRFLIVLIFLISTINFAQSKENSIRYLKSNLGFLSDDLLEGRETTKRGEKVASLYIAQELQKYGIKPFGDSNSYFQSFQMDLTSLIEVGASIERDGETIDLADSLFIVSKREVPDNKYSGMKKKIVFAGYGIVDNELEIDEFEDIDAKGKIVIMVDGIPNIDSSKISLEKKKTLSSNKTKVQNAIDNGAEGIIMFPSDRYKMYWKYILRWSKSESMEIHSEKEKTLNIPTVIVNQDAGNLLFEGEEYSFDELNKLKKEGEFLPSFEFNAELTLNYNLVVKQTDARNVVGILPGNDSQLKNEYVTISAHYDHLGVSGEDIFNGADDDGSGTISVLESARKLALSDNNDRSIVFVFHTGEEKGLLGSEYVTSHSEWIKNTLADINIDMVGRESVDTIFSIGSDRLSSELKGTVEEVNEGNKYFVLDYKFDDPNDPNRFYYRSDHYNYAKYNIPVVFFFDNMTKDYHRPTDTIEKINFEKIYKVTELVRDLAEEVSNRDEKFVLDGLKKTN